MAKNQLGDVLFWAEEQPHIAQAQANLLDGDQQPATRGENLLHVAEHQLARLRHHQVPSAAPKTLLSQRPLHRFPLRANGRLAAAQLRGRREDAAFPGDAPDMELVMAVEPFHGSETYSSFSKSEF